MMRITDKRKQVQAKPLTFADLEVGDWFEHANLPVGESFLLLKFADGTALRFGDISTSTVVLSASMAARRIDVEIVIHGEKP